MTTQLEPRDLATRLRPGPHTDAQGAASSPPPVLLDVRQPEEHAFAALPGSRLVPLGELPDRLDELADWHDREVVVYCHHGVRSLHAIQILRQAGFTRLLNLRGGIDRWSLDVDPSVPRY